MTSARLSRLLLCLCLALSVAAAPARGADAPPQDPKAAKKDKAAKEAKDKAAKDKAAKEAKDKAAKEKAAKSIGAKNKAAKSIKTAKSTKTTRPKPSQPKAKETAIVKPKPRPASTLVAPPPEDTTSEEEKETAEMVEELKVAPRSFRQGARLPSVEGDKISKLATQSTTTQAKPGPAPPPPQNDQVGDSAVPGPDQGSPQLAMRYHGVAPGRNELPPRAPRLPIVKGPQRMTFPGFQVKDGQPTVFVQLTGPVEYTVNEKPGQVVLTLHDTTVNVRNNLHSLRAEEFHTVVKRVRIERRKNAVDVLVDVSGAVAHQERLAPAENGYSMLVMQVSPMNAAATDDRPLDKVKEEARAAPSPAK